MSNLNQAQARVLCWLANGGRIVGFDPAKGRVKLAGRQGLRSRYAATATVVSLLCMGAVWATLEGEVLLAAPVALVPHVAFSA